MSDYPKVVSSLHPKKARAHYSDGTPKERPRLMPEGWEWISRTKVRGLDQGVETFVFLDGDQLRVDGQKCAQVPISVILAVIEGKMI